MYINLKMNYLISLFRHFGIYDKTKKLRNNHQIPKKLKISALFNKQTLYTFTI